MTNTFTLDDIKAAADKKYGSTFLDLGDGEEKVELVNALRLPKGQRRELLDLQKEMAKKHKEAKEAEENGEESDGEDSFEDSIDDLRKSIQTVARTKPQADRVLKACGEDAAMLMSVFDFYTEETELGEASPSQD